MKLKNFITFRNKGINKLCDFDLFNKKRRKEELKFYYLRI